MPAQLRIFYAHSIRHSDEEIEQGMARVAEGCRQAWPNAVIEVTSGKEDWHRRIAVAGDWNGWAKSVPKRLPDGEPRYHLIVVPQGRYPVGRAVKAVCAAADQADVDIYLWDEFTGEFTRAHWERRT